MGNQMIFVLNRTMKSSTIGVSERATSARLIAMLLKDSDQRKVAKIVYPGLASSFLRRNERG